MKSTKGIILRCLVVLGLVFVSTRLCVYGRVLVYCDIDAILNDRIENIVIRTSMEDLSNDIEKINGNKPRFMLQAVVDENLPDYELEKRILSQSTVDELLVYAYSYLGTPYRYGGSTRRGIDCSAFVMSVYRAATDIKLPRTSVYQAMEGKKISKSELKRGDLVFFANSARGRISHVGIVENVSESGEVRFIHAASSRGVMVSSLKNSYWWRRFRYAKRIVSLE